MVTEHISGLASGVPYNTRSLSLTTTAVYDDEFVENRGVLQLLADADATYYFFSEDPLRDGDFESKAIWAPTSGSGIETRGDEDTELDGGSERGPRSWQETGTTGAITANLSSPQFGTRDCEMSLADALTRLRQTTFIDLIAAGTYVFKFNHLDSNASNTIDFQIRSFRSDGTIQTCAVPSTWNTSDNWTTVAGSGTTAQISQLFTADQANRHEIIFRPTPATVGAFNSRLDRVYICKVALTTHEFLPDNVPRILLANGKGRISAIMGSSTGNLSIVELR